MEACEFDDREDYNQVEQSETDSKATFNGDRQSQSASLYAMSEISSEFEELTLITSPEFDTLTLCRAFQRVFPVLTANINVNDYLDHLLAKEVISFGLMDSIKSKDGLQEKARELLVQICNRDGGCQAMMELFQSPDIHQRHLYDSVMKEYTSLMKDRAIQLPPHTVLKTGVHLSKTDAPFGKYAEYLIEVFQTSNRQKGLPTNAVQDAKQILTSNVAFASRLCRELHCLPPEDAPVNEEYIHLVSLQLSPLSCISADTNFEWLELSRLMTDAADIKDVCFHCYITDIHISPFVSANHKKLMEENLILMAVGDRDANMLQYCEEKNSRNPNTTWQSTAGHVRRNKDMPDCVAVGSGSGGKGNKGSGDLQEPGWQNTNKTSKKQAGSYGEDAGKTFLNDIPTKPFENSQSAPASKLSTYRSKTPMAPEMTKAKAGGIPDDESQRIDLPYPNLSPGSSEASVSSSREKMGIRSSSWDPSTAGHKVKKMTRSQRMASVDSPASSMMSETTDKVLPSLMPQVISSKSVSTQETPVRNFTESPNKPSDTSDKMPDLLKVLRQVKFGVGKSKGASNDIMNSVTKQIVDVLQKEHELVLQPKYAGSSFEGAKIESADEYDVLIILDGKDIDRTKHHPQFASLHPRNPDNFKFKEYLTNEGFLDPAKITSQVYSWTQLAINKLFPTGHEYQVGIRKSGPAVTLSIEPNPKSANPKNFSKIDVDLVAAFEILNENYVAKPCRLDVETKPVNGRQPQKEVLWRKSFSLFEKQRLKNIDKDQGCRRQCLRLLKFLRVREAPLKGLASYHYKILLLNVCQELPETKETWAADKLAVRFWGLLEKLVYYLQMKNMPHCMDEEINVFEDIKSAALENMRTRLNKIMRKGVAEIEKILNRDPIL